jgi:hypothetical protein
MRAAFYVAGGADFEDLAKFDGSSWVELSSDFNGPPTALGFGLDGFLYAGGTFSTPFPAIAKWNGVQLSGLGSGLTGGIVAAGAIAVDENGDMPVASNLPTA